jgi:hypothetical protein
MRTKVIMTILLSISFAFTYAQNEKVNRDGFTLTLPVDGEQYYEQKVVSSPYFVKEKALQIYPGEKLFIEAEIEKEEIISMKVVKENLNPEKTIEVKFTQTVKDGKSEMMMLKVVNPFKKDLEYKAMMFIVGHDKWINTNVIPVKAKLVAYETWPNVIITLVLTDWKFSD